MVHIGGVTATFTDIHRLGGRGEAGVGRGLATPHCNEPTYYVLLHIASDSTGYCQHSYHTVLVP